MKRLPLLILLVLVFISQNALAQEPVRVDPDELKAEARLIEAHSLYLIDDRQGAYDAYEKIITEFPENDVAYYEIARIAAQLKQDALAEKYYKEAIRLNPDNEWYYLSYAEYLEDNMRLPEAVELYEQLHKAFPNDPDYLMSLAYAQLKSGDQKKAIKSLEEHINTFGLSEPAAVRLYSLYLRTHEDKKAQQLYSNATEDYPRNTEIHLIRAKHLIDKEKTQQAMTVLEEVIQINPDHEEASILLAEIRIESNTSSGKSLESLMPLLKNSSISIDRKLEKLLPYVHAYIDDGDETLAPDLLQAATILAEAHPNDPKSHSLAGDVLAKMNKRNQAIKHYENTVAIYKTNYLVWEQLIHLCREVHDYPKAEKYSEECLSYFPNQADIYFLRAQAQVRLEDYKSALSSLEEYGFMTMRKPQAQYRKHVLESQAWTALGNKDKAQKSLEKALEINADAAPALIQKALLLLEEGNREAAREIMTALQAETDPYLPLLQVHLRKAENGSLPTFSELTEENRQDPHLLELIGDLWKEKDAEKALQFWKKAAELFPYEKKTLQNKINSSS